MDTNQSEVDSKTNAKNNQLIFEKLTPTHLSDEDMKGYTDALDFVFQEDDLFNIAVTGPYASGKSSVIKTYEDNHKQLDGIHISLSYFSPTLTSKIKKRSENNELAFEDELMLERKIINQLVHQVDPEKIPATEFKVTSESKKKTGMICSAIIALITLYIIFNDATWFVEFISKQPLVSFLAIGSFIGLVAYYLFSLQRGKNIIAKLKIFENEIDISTSHCDVSYFDKYLNEIIYILDKSQLDYIVFEDIDRYEDNLILNKLRELNYTYNKKQIKIKPKPIKFIYLIKDEMFESKERTKFFDYILPIVPIVDSSNSLGKMVDIFKSQAIFNDFSESFLDTLALYLDDIRLIKNICNEYLIYKSKLAHNNSWFDTQKLLAIIVYKNIFPSDFSLTRLGLGQGVVHRILVSLKDQKEESYKIRCNDINKQIETIQSKIESIENEYLHAIDELDALYICLFRENYANDTIYYINDEIIVGKSHLEIVQRLKQTNYQAKSYNGYKRDFTKQFEELNTNPDYLKRKEIISTIENKKKSDLYEQLNALEQEKLQLKSPKKITEIIKIFQNDGVTVDALFAKHFNTSSVNGTDDNKTLKRYKQEFENLTSSCYFPLLRVLIIQGYIDEYYSDYTSFFDAQGLPPNDTLFLRNISERVNTPWDLQLRKPELVLKKLRADLSNFYEHFVLNYTLLDFILMTHNKTALTPFINLLKIQRKVDFINAYLARCYTLLKNEDETDKQKSLYLFIEELNKQFPQAWQQISGFDQKLYLYLSFIHNHPSVVESMNEGGKLKAFIDDSSDFLLIDQEWNTISDLHNQPDHYKNKIASTLERLDIKFKYIEHSIPPLLVLVEKSNRYQLNYNNVKHMLQKNYNFVDVEHHIIQALLDLNDDDLIKSYSLNNLDELVLSMAEADITSIDDNQQTVLWILNHDDISLPAKLAYLNKLSTMITALHEINDQNIWDALLEKQKIQYTAENIVHYFFKYASADDNKTIINKQLTDFINQNPKFISSKEANLSQLITDDDDVDLFLACVVENVDIENSKYEMLISWFDGKDIANFDDEDLDKEKISILIKHKVINLDEDNDEEQDLNFMRKNYPDNMLELITHNIEGYINRLQNDDSLIDHDEIISLLSAQLSVEQKIDVLNLISDPISIGNVNYPNEIQKHIFENNFNVDDLDFVTGNEFYNKASTQIQDCVIALAAEHIARIIELDQICNALLIELLKSDDISVEQKYQLLNNHLSALSAKQSQYYFKLIEQHSNTTNYFSTLFIGETQTFEATPLNEQIIENISDKWQFNFNVRDGVIVVKGKKLVKL